MKRLLVTGSRYWYDFDAVAYGLALAIIELAPEPIILVHGACPSGVDDIADRLWRGFHKAVERHPADWALHGRMAGPIRNKHMVSLGADLCVGWPLGRSPGTRGCMKLAREADIPVWNLGDA